MSQTRHRNLTCFQPRWIHLLITALFCIGSNPGQAAEPSWTPLFNGQDFEGFSFHLGRDGADNNATFTINHGAIVSTGKPSGYMHTRKSYRRYTLQYEWAFPRPQGLKDDKEFRGNSGCLIHIGEKNALGLWPRSIEVQGTHHQAGLILPIPRNLQCKLTDDKEARAKALKPLGQWQTTTVEVDGGNMTISLNGAIVSTVRDCELTEGPIGFQSEGKEIHFRNIRILEE